MAAVYIIGAIIAAIALYFTLGRKSSKYNYPPSPPGYNILKGGHAYLFPPNLDVHLPGTRQLTVGWPGGLEMGR